MATRASVPMDEIEDAIDRVNNFVRLAHKAKQIAESERASWEDKFDRIFFREGIHRDICKTGLRLRWNDPDSNYREDVQAYVGALMEMVNDIEKKKRNKMAYLELIHELSSGK